MNKNITNPNTNKNFKEENMMNVKMTCDHCKKEFEGETLFLKTYLGNYIVSEDGVIEGDEEIGEEYCLCPECAKEFNNFINNK